ncbi:MAG: inositol monophosphatase [Bacteroidales bacterium]|nr:inositol monophosphatase [Bacteroidales bacterium]
MNLELLTKQVTNLTRAVGTYLKNEIKNIQKEKIINKGHNDFVTYVDKNSERRLVAELTKLLPEAGFIAEENNTYKRAKNYNWVIDPLDGTTNYIHGLPVYAISVALIHRDEVVSGVVFEINQQECFYAWKKGGAYLNNHKISCTDTENLSESFFATGFPYSDFSRIDGYLEVFKELMKSTHGVRRLGSAATDLAYLACGRFDGFFEYGLHPWDVAAGELIVREAGGIVSDFKGGNNYLFGKEIIAANSYIYKGFLELMEKHF